MLVDELTIYDVLDLGTYDRSFHFAQGSIMTSAAAAQIASSSKPAKAAGGQSSAGKSSKPAPKVLNPVDRASRASKWSQLGTNASFMHVQTAGD